MFSLLSIVMVIQVVSALTIIVLVLLQQGKGADMGSAFGTGSAGSLFGASGAANFLSRMTKWAAVVFFVSTGALAWIGHKGPGGANSDSGLMQNYQPENRSVPSLPGAAPQNGASSVPGASIPAAPQGSQPAGAAPAANDVPGAAPSTSAPAQAPAAPAASGETPAPAAPSTTAPQ